MKPSTKASPPSAASTSSERRSEIQGLRAIAALLVVIYHLWPGRLPGGYIGVDVFFVISGFLITAHLMREADSHAKINLPRFWARRARRLLPGAYVVLVATAIGVWMWVPQVFWSQFFKEIVASTVYVENWSLARDAVDYLAADNAASPTQHYWTLSAEEQFYLVWPLLVVVGLFIAARTAMHRRTAMVVVLGTTVAASLAYSLYLTGAEPERAFFITPTRAWEFGAGAMLALVPVAALRRLPQVPRTAFSWVGIVTIIGCGFVLNGSTPMPGVAAIVVVVGTLLFLSAGDPMARWSPTRMLETRPFQFTGDISYALYLWHWPLIILLPYVQGHPNGNRTLIGILVLTFVLATASTYLIENPIRTTHAFKIRVPGVTFALVAVGAVAVAGPSYAAMRHQDQIVERDRTIATSFVEDPPECAGAASHDPTVPCSNPKLDTMLVPTVEAAPDDIAAGVECASREPDEPIIPCSGGRWSDDSVPKVAIIGDSHARMMSTALDVLADDGVLAWDGYFQSGCLWGSAEPHRTAYTTQCNSFKERLQPILADRADRYDFVITTGRVSKLDGSPEEQAADLLAEWKVVTDLDMPIVTLTDIPEMGTGLIRCLEATERSEMSECDRDRAEVLTEDDPFVLAARQVTGGGNIDMHPYYCDEQKCQAVSGGVIMYANSNHLSATYVTTLAPILERELRRLGMLPTAQ